MARSPARSLAATSHETVPLLPPRSGWARRPFPMYTPPILEEYSEEEAEDREYEAQFEEEGKVGAPEPEPEPTPAPAPAPPGKPPTPAPTPAVEPEEVKEAPHILVDLPPHVEQAVEEVAERGGRCGVGRCRAWLMVLREELRHEEQWRLPVLPRNAFIDFKFRRPPPPEQAGAETPNLWFVLYRFALLVYWSSWFTVAVVGAQKGVHIPPPVYEYMGYGALWLIYATNWTAILVWVYLVLACLCLVVSAPPAMAAPPDNGIVRTSRGLADTLRTVTWALRDTVAPAACMVTMLYWFLLFPLFRCTNFVDVHLHLVNALIILADLWLSRMPYWLLHFPLPMAYLCLYIVFAGIFYGAGGHAPDGEDFIYPWLDFDRPHITVPIMFLVVLVIFPIVHAALWGLERRSRQLAKRRFERQDADWAAGEQIKEEWATRPGETGRRRRQRRQRLVTPPGASSGRPHSWRYRWPWGSNGFRPLTADELTALRQELLLDEEEGMEEGAGGGGGGSEEGSFQSAQSV